MTRTELAGLLGISISMVSRLAKRGMPTDTLERAQRWRKRHLEPGRMKGTRFDGSHAPDTTQAGDGPAAALPSDDPAEPQAGAVNSFHMAKTQRETAEARMAELKLGELTGQLVRRDTVERAVYDAFRSLRDHAFAAPQRAAPRVVGMQDVRTIERAMADELRRAFDGWEARMGERLGSKKSEGEAA